MSCFGVFFGLPPKVRIVKPCFQSPGMNSSKRGDPTLTSKMITFETSQEFQMLSSVHVTNPQCHD